MSVEDSSLKKKLIVGTGADDFDLAAKVSPQLVMAPFVSLAGPPPSWYSLPPVPPSDRVTLVPLTSPQRLLDPLLSVDFPKTSSSVSPLTGKADGRGGVEAIRKGSCCEVS